MQAAIDNIVGTLSSHPQNTGLVVGLLSPGHRAIFGYGRASHASAEPPAGDTLFEIGSITKVFTTALLAALTAGGRLHLEDPVRDLVPSLSNLPAGITLLRLATHTAGLPKMPSNLVRSMLRNPRNPYAAYTTADLLHYLSRYKPNQRRRPGGQINYSNLGFALLGHILAQSTGSPYEQALVTTLCDPLAMPDTRVELTPEQQERLSPPHAASGKRIPPWELPAFAAAGALRSTADDMLNFLAANLASAQAPVTGLLQSCHGIRAGAFPPPGHLQRWVSRLSQADQNTQHHRQGIALGWVVGRLGPDGARVHWHHGATGGYRAFTGFVKSSGTGVVVLANQSPGRRDLLSGRTSADDIGFRILEILNAPDH